jgi:LmbE family N-acetylglucosaminyl deacetylase
MTTTHRSTGVRLAEPTIASLGTVLGVWAHPDDEAYLSGGLMALARRARQRVAVLTATAGEGADPSARPRGRGRLAQRRRAELAASLARLGVREHHVSGIADGSCGAVPLEDGAALVGRWMRHVEPDTIVTFGPEGMTGHPDHRAVSAWTTAAWHLADRPCRLLHATVTPDFHRRWQAENEQIGLWLDGEGPCTAATELALSIELEGELLDRKVAALEAHASQVGPLVDALGPDRWRHWWATESFVEVRAEVQPEGSLGTGSVRSAPAQTRSTRTVDRTSPAEAATTRS